MTFFKATSICPSPYSRMGRFITFLKLCFWRVANTFRIVIVFDMMFSMLTKIVEKLKIFYSVIIFDAINMVDFLNRLKISTNLFFHNQTMFSDITSIVAKRMSRTIYKYVPIISLIWHGLIMPEAYMCVK